MNTNGKPREWPLVRIGDIAQLQLGKMLDRQKNTKGHYHPYLRNINVRWFSFDLSDVFQMRFSREESEKFNIRNGDVLICEGGEPGRAAVWMSGETDIKFQKAIHRLRPSDRVTSEWLALFMRYAASNGILSEYTTGTTIRHLTAQALSRVLLPLPPVDEQRRIVSVLRDKMQQLSGLRSDLHRVIKLRTAHFEKLLLETMNPADRSTWKTMLLSDLGEWTSGGTPKTGNAGFYDGRIPWIRSGDLPDGPVVSHERTISDRGLANSAAKMLPAGTVLIAMYGATIGRLGITTYDCATNQAVASCQVNKKLITPEFLFYSLLEKREHLVSLGQGGAQPNISQAILKRQTIAVPPLKDQIAIAKTLDRVTMMSTAIEKDISRSAELLARMERAILSEAFA